MTENSDTESLDQQKGDGFGVGGFNSGLEHDEPVEQAWVHYIVGCLVIMVGLPVLFKMFRARKVLEIRARSAYLVMLLGSCLLIDLAIDVHVESEHLFGWPVNVFFTQLVYFFTIFTIASCYVWRVVRLGVSFAPRIKRAIPWVMSEKLAVSSSLFIGWLSTFIPAFLYDRSYELHHEVLQELDVVWKCQVGLISVQLCLLPIVWMVDDIFRISWELCIIVMLGVMDIVVIRLSDTSVLAPEVKKYFNSRNIGLLWTTGLFGLSVIDPMRRLYFNPMARPVAISRKARARVGIKRPNGTSGSQGDGGMSDSENDLCGDRTRASSMLRTNWSYDKMASVPAVAEAFRAFAWRALCHESVMFLEEVARYESGDYGIARPVVSQFAAFNQIVKRFIVDGAIDEINISGTDKERLLFIFKDGSSAFFGQTDEERRLVFSDAYLEIRSMLEVNLLHRFFHTDGFRNLPSISTPEPVSAGEP
ncbi:unnamed protein product [Scytosiphon promiscuus]